MEKQVCLLLMQTDMQSGVFLGFFFFFVPETELSVWNVLSFL